MLSNNGDRDFLVACAYPTKQMFAEMRRNAVVLCRNAAHTFSLSLLRKWSRFTWKIPSGRCIWTFLNSLASVCNSDRARLTKRDTREHCGLVRICRNWLSPFSPSSFLFSQLCTFRMTPWPIPDRWWIGSKQSSTTASSRSRRLSGACPVTSPIHGGPPARPRGAVRAAAMETGAGSQLINGAPARRDRSSVRHLRSPALRGPHTCNHLHFFAYV